MNKLFRILFFSVLCFALYAVSALAAEVSVSDVPAFPEGTVILPIEQPRMQRGRFGAYAMNPSKMGVFPDFKMTKRPGSSLEPIYIRFRKEPGPSFSGAYWIIAGDLRKYATLSFWIRGERGGENFEIGLNDLIASRREDAIMGGSIYRYLPGGITKEWQQVKIPLEDFFGADFSRVHSLVFSFSQPGAGAVWVDGFVFHEEALVQREDDIIRAGELLLDNFDYSDLNLLGRKTNAYKKTPSFCSASRVEKPRRGKEGRSLRLDYDKQSTGWAGYFSLFNQIDGAYYDLSQFREIRFWVRGAKGKEVFDVGMSDRSWLTIGDSVKCGTIDKYLKKGVTKDWQEVVIPFRDFGKLDWSQMGSFVINFSKPGKGTLFLDDVRVIRKSDEELLKEWDKQ